VGWLGVAVSGTCPCSGGVNREAVYAAPGTDEPSMSDRFNNLLYSGPIPTTCQPPEVIGYWRLDETSGPTFADDYGDNNATCTNCPTPTTGQVGGAQTFNGSSTRLTIPHDASLNFGDSFTIEAWVRTTNCSNTKVITGKYSTQQSWWIGCLNNNRAAFSLRNASSAGNSLTIDSGSTLINTGEWVHIAGVRDGNGADGFNILYVNGVEVANVERTYTSSNFNNSQNMTIGWHDNAFHFDGDIDEVAIHNRALTPAEIQRHYRAGLVNLGYEYDNWTTADGNWNNDASWYGDAPGSDDYVAILNNNTLTQPETPACVDVMANATLDFGSHELTVNGAFSNRGTVKQTKPVNTVSELVEFLHVSGTAGTLYRGAEVTPTTTGLGNVEVTIRAADFDNDDYCTTTGADNGPPYAERCFTITAETSAEALVRLYAHTDELAGLDVGDLRPYRFTGSWDPLTTNLATGPEGDFAYAEANTLGFSSFLLGGDTSPTAVSLANISAGSSTAPLTPITLLVLALLLLGSGMVYARRRTFP
jgi:hypothetical protein